VGELAQAGISQQALVVLSIARFAGEDVSVLAQAGKPGGLDQSFVIEAALAGLGTFGRLDIFNTTSDETTLSFPKFF
jgi:hypothetical protein